MILPSPSQPTGIPLLPLRELWSQLKLHPSPITYRLSFIMLQTIDWDVYLPSIGKNLQRPFVWSPLQKAELIYSVLIDRHIPHMALINSSTESSEQWTFQIIDGKQRLSALVDFIQDKFSIVVGGNRYTFSQLPEDLQTGIMQYPLKFYEVCQYHHAPIADAEKIAWFKFINFAGTQQDVEHLQSL